MVRFPVEARYFYILGVQTDCVPQIAPYSREKRYLSPGKWAGREIDLSLLVLRLRMSGVRPPLIRLYGVYTDFILTLTFTCTLHVLPLSFQFLFSLIIFFNHLSSLLLLILSSCSSNYFLSSFLAGPFSPVL
jgi:hypothetical protein